MSYTYARILTDPTQDKGVGVDVRAARKKACRTDTTLIEDMRWEKEHMPNSYRAVSAFIVEHDGYHEVSNHNKRDDGFLFLPATGARYHRGQWTSNLSEMSEKTRLHRYTLVLKQG